MKLSNASFPSSAMSALYSMYSSYRAIKDGIFKYLVVNRVIVRSFPYSIENRDVYAL